MNKQLKGLVIAVSAALSTLPALSHAASQDVRDTSFQALKAGQQHGYLIQLNSEGAYQTKATNKTQITAKINNQQSGIIKQLKALDSNLQVHGQVKLVGNYITVTMNDTAAKALAGNVHVSKITRIETSNLPKQPQNTRLYTPNQKTAVKSTTKADPSDGAGVRIAVIGTGVDYTHSLLGGAGTAESYDEAWLNNANEYGGFPTSVVVAGRDFSTEAGWGVDDNPIDTNATYQREYGAMDWYPTGQGTMLAGIVHEIAPAAEIVAVKIANLSPNDWGGMNFTQPSSNTLEPAIEWLLDPNGDGDFSDKMADIVVMQSFGSALGSYNGASEGIDGSAAAQRMLQFMAAHGMLVVSDTGGNPNGSMKYNLSYEAATPEVLAVNPIEMTESGSYYANEMTAHGPVRMNMDVIKPDLSAVATADVVAVGSGTEMTTRTNADVSAARIAATAAVLKSSRPELSAIEIKALLMNTASSVVLEASDSSNIAELTHAGHGVENIEAAINSPIVAWDERNYQPAVNFGVQEVASEVRLVKEVRVKNLSNEAQTYQVNIATNGDVKEGQTALNWTVPAEVNIPANGSVVVPVVLTINASELKNWPLKEQSAHTLENWKAIEFNGFINFSSSTNPEINVGWLVKARPKTTITKNFNTYTEEWSGGPGDGLFPNGVNHLYQEFTNDSASETEFVVLPVVKKVPALDSTVEDIAGVQLNMLGMDLMPDDQCTSGQKLVMGVNFKQPIDVAFANFLDRGPDAVYVVGFRESAVEAYGMSDGFEGDLAMDEEHAFIFHVELNELGQPTAYFIDLEMVYDWSNPRGRYTQSILPTTMTPNGKNLLAQFCTDELTHHDFDLAEFDSNWGIYAETDRFSLTEQYAPITLFNPTYSGPVQEVTGYDWFGNEYTETFFMGAAVGFSAVEDDPLATETEFSNFVTLAPGESARLQMGTDGYSWGSVGEGFMVMSLDDNYALWSATSVNDADGNVIGIVVEDQSFDVVETDVANGDIIGRVEADTDGFWAYQNTEGGYSPIHFELLNAIPGDPISINSLGDIVVNNTDAVDYETLPTIRLQVTTIQGNTHSQAVEVVINVMNGNDNAPVALSDIGTITVDQNAEVSVETASHFGADLDGDTLSYSAQGLPVGINIDPSTGLITGSTDDVNTHSISISASDGTFEASIAMTLDVESTDSGGGSLSWMLLLLTALVPGRKRQ